MVSRPSRRTPSRNSWPSGGSPSGGNTSVVKSAPWQKFTASELAAASQRVAESRARRSAAGWTSSSTTTPSATRAFVQAVPKRIINLWGGSIEGWPVRWATKNTVNNLANRLKVSDKSTWMENTDNLTGDIRSQQDQNIWFLDSTQQQLLDKNQQLETQLMESQAQQQRVVDQRMSEQDRWLQNIMDTINKTKDVDIEKLNLTTNQNAQALSWQLADSWLLNSEQASQASATVISRANETTQLKKLDIDSKAMELITQAQQEFQSRRDAILAQQWVNESMKAEQITQLNAQYSQIIETYNTNALNEKKNADAQANALRQWLAEWEISGSQQELMKETQARARLDALERTTRSTDDKAVYLFSSLSNYFGSDVVVDGIINSYISSMKENGTLASTPLSSIFTAIKNQVVQSRKV